MMKCKKIPARILALLLAAILCAGCGSNSDQTTAAPSSAQTSESAEATTTQPASTDEATTEPSSTDEAASESDSTDEASADSTETDTTQPASTDEATTEPASSDDVTSEEPSTDTAPTGEGFYMTINGFNVKIGDVFADVQDKLGDEVKPAESIDSCDTGSDWVQTTHYYDGGQLTENKDGLIDSFTMEITQKGGEFAIMGAVKIGSTADEVKAVLGNPDSEDAESLMYMSGQIWIGIYLDAQSGTVSGAAIMGMLE